MKKNFFPIILLAIVFLSCDSLDIQALIKSEYPVRIRINPITVFAKTSSTVQFRAYFINNDGSESDVTNGATWTVTGNATPLAAPGSFLTSNATGNATISASYRSFSTDTSNGNANLIITFNDTICVSPLGNDTTGDGSATKPYATIEHAISLASSGTNIRIAKGTYTTTQITLKEGVSLCGGYDTEWNFNIFNNRATIRDISTTGADPKGTIEGDATITSATVIEGLDIFASTAYTGNATAALKTAGNPSIIFCILTRGAGTAAKYGIYSTASGSMMIFNIDINENPSPAPLISYGIYSESGMVITNSNINSGNSTTFSYGIYTTGTIIVRNTTVNGGSGATDSYGIYSSDTGASVIELSTINGGSAPNSIAFYLTPSVASSLLVIKNSTINGGTGTISSTGITLANTGNPSPCIYNNIILCASSSSSTYCMTIGQNSMPVIANNTCIIENSTVQAYGIYSQSSAKPYIYNNIFYMSSAFGQRWCIYESDINADPSAVMNNIFYSPSSIYVYHDNESSSNWDVAGMEDTSAGNGAFNNGGTTATGNIIADPALVNTATKDYHLLAGSPAIGSGLNGMDEGWLNFPMSGTLPMDFDSNPRPNVGGGPWSIGAYE